LPKESIVAKWTSTKLYLGSRYNIETNIKEKCNSMRSGIRKNGVEEL
jgi:hypothetical protein